MICWERRKLERSFGGRTEETLSLLSTRPTKGGSFLTDLLLFLLAFDAVERES